MMQGCIVLSSRQAVSLPMFSRTSLNEHIEGSFNGSVGMSSTSQHVVYFPQKSRSFYVGSSVELDDSDFLPVIEVLSQSGTDGVHSLRDSFHEAASEIPLTSPGVLYVEQRTPFGFVCLNSRHVDVHFFGLYNNKCSVLYWTTVDNFEDVLRVECPNEFWVHRFRPQRNFSVALFVKRICSRWYRWQESINHPSQRFQALETSLINSMVFFDG